MSEVGKKILISGASGQLGYELQRFVPTGWSIVAFDSSELDITQVASVDEVVAREQPDWVVNAAAYTSVDKAESEADIARLVNAEGAANLARAAKACGGRMVQVSTDFVFDGLKSSPYTADDRVCPTGVYGQTKLEGELAVAEVLGPNALIIRTAWAYSTNGENFVKTMLRLMSERETLGVVSDQVGTPTWAADLARVIYMSIDHELSGIYAWTDAGVASWYDFAHAIQQLGKELELLDDSAALLNPISASSFSAAAVRPAFSVLDKKPLREAIGYTGMHWRDALKYMMKELKNG